MEDQAQNVETDSNKPQKIKSHEPTSHEAIETISGTAHPLRLDHLNEISNTDITNDRVELTEEDVGTPSRVSYRGLQRSWAHHL